MKRSLGAALALVLSSSLVACSTPERAPSAPSPPVRDTRPRDEDLGTHHRSITTGSPEAQRQFDRGLVYVYAFDHASAIAAFHSAVDADPHCAMAFWGIALANGPHINNPNVDEEHAKAAWEAVEEARRHAAGHADATERALIRAMWRRYTKEYSSDRGGVDAAYALAMRDVWAEHRDDADVATLFAESLMQLHPWDLWTPEGAAKADTDEIVATLEAALRLQPTNPGANHLYIHAVEGSRHPERADAAADRLRTLVPDAGHLLHMPSHIDARLGRWALASDTNVRAVAADERHDARISRKSFTRLYMAHNRHFLAFSSMMEGRSEVALAAARSMVARIPPELDDDMAKLVDAHVPIVLHVLVRFGRWEDVLREPDFEPRLPVARAVRCYARGVSLAALGRLDEADAEAKALAALVDSIDDRKMGANKAREVLPIPVKVVAAEIAFRRGKTDEALALLREAVAVQDGLKHDEPPGWMQPARHVLAATLLAAKKHAEAEKVLREDLERNPENGWALTGLVKCLRARGAAPAELAATEERLAKAWARADVKIASPCLCQPGD